MTKYLLFTILVLAAFLAVSVKSCQDIRTDRNRLSDNQRTLLADIEFYRTECCHCRVPDIDEPGISEIRRRTKENRRGT